MSVEISHVGKYGYFTKKQAVHLLNGRVERVAVHLDNEDFSNGRTVWLKGGNVPVVHDGEKWVEYNPEGVAS